MAVIARVIGAGILSVLALGALGGGAAWYFRGDRTRLTVVPPTLVGTAHVTGARLPPPPAHVIVVIEENKSYRNIVGNTSAPYLNSLIPHAAFFTHSYAIAHPSQPNYMALFTGRVNSNGDGCPAVGIPLDTPNLASELRSAGRSFVGYAESEPSQGFRGCFSDDSYGQKHAPWAHFTNVTSAENTPYANFPTYAKLPTVSIVIPNLSDDMHSGSIRRGDAWLRRNIAPLLAWGATHNTLLIITWDESSAAIANHIPTFFVGPMVQPGRYAEVVSHYRVLRTIEDLYHLPHAGLSAKSTPITDIWNR